MALQILSRRQHQPGTRPISPRAAITCGIVAAAMVLGGGGSSAPGSELGLELVVACAAAAWLLTKRADERPCPRWALALALLVLVLPALQLVPLPPQLWRGLPGRTIEAAGLGVVDASSAWMPWTLSAERTCASLLTTVPAALVICFAAMLDAKGRRALLLTIAALGIASLLLGVLQLADGSERTWRFYADNSGYLNGFQANRNAEVDVLLLALAALPGALVLPAPHARRRLMSPWRLAVLLGAGALLLLGCVLTGSRAGIALVVPVAILLLWRHRPHVRRRLLPLGTAAAVIALAGCIVLVQPPGSALRQVVERFSAQHDVRTDLWQDTLPALRSVWPAGGGVGTFRPVFEASEPLASVDPTRPVRAHNDYLEFVLEGGAPAIAVIAAGAILLGAALARASRHADPRDWPTLTFVTATFIVIAVHSLVDYPLRSMALAILGAAASGLLFAVVRDTDGNVQARDPGMELSRG